MPRIRDIFFDPPLVVARLGGSTTPQVAFEWVESADPHNDGETSVRPAWSLNVLADGSVSPYMPDRVAFRDSAGIRPVCPFLELWAVVGDSDDASTWTEQPLTPALLIENGASLASLNFVVNAQNRKAERRTGEASLRFGTNPPARLRADNHAPQEIQGRSPANATPPMIPAGRRIPLGSFQVLRSMAQPAPGSTAWASEVNVETIRCRFTPARGLVYGPPRAANPQPDGSIPVDPTRAFLDPAARWADAAVNSLVQPADTFDGAENASGLSAGIVDDTCEAQLLADLTTPSGDFSASATVFVAPPDFAPDRRPFLSIADELNDRIASQSARSDAMSPAELTSWVQDLFERIYETVSLFNVDFWRARRAARLSGAALREPPIAGDSLPGRSSAGGGADRLRNPDFALAAPAADRPLPLTEHARMRHRALSDVDALRNFVAQRPGRMRELVRAVFECEPSESSGVTTLRMPPFMRNSNALPLTLAAWQYDLLMRWVDSVEQTGITPADAPPLPAALSDGAAERRRHVLARASGQ